MRAEADGDNPKPWRASLPEALPEVTPSCVVGAPLVGVAVNTEGPCREQ